MNQELRQLNNRRIALRTEINRLVHELNELENEMKSKMVENLTVDQLFSLLTNEEETEDIETTEATEVEETITVETEATEVTEAERTILTAENITQAVGDEIAELVRTNCSTIDNETEEVEIETEEVEVEAEVIETTEVETEEIQEESRILDASEVTSDMLTDAMHDAMLTLVGVKYQDLFTDGENPRIGQRIKLKKETETSNTYGCLVEDNRTVGILPQSDEKIAQLDNIEAHYIRNRSITPDSRIIQTEYEVVGFIPGCFIFIDPVNDGGSTTTTTTSETTEEYERIDGEASTVAEARSIFENAKNDCTINIIRDEGDKFVIEYMNHRANLVENFECKCAIAKAN